MYISKLGLAFLFSMGLTVAHAQTGMGIGTLTPDASAALDISSSSKGVLFPRVALTSKADASTVAAPANGLVVYNTSASNGLAAQLMVNAGTTASPNWVPLAGSSWALTGNSGTVGGTNFLGTTDNQPLVIKANNAEVARFQPGGALWLGGSTSPAANLFLGYQAGLRNTSGTMNQFDGYQAGYNNTSGEANQFIGTQTGYSNVTGGYNHFIGYQAGYSNNSGSSNIFFGYQAGNKNISGNNNVFVGLLAGFNSATGGSDVYMGFAAGQNTTSAFANTAIGTNAARGTTTGSYLTAVGFESGLTNTTGNYNSFIGYRADATANNLVNATAIGYLAKVSASNSLVLGGTDVNAVKVGIGVTAPTEVLQVAGNILASGTITQNSDRRLKENIRPLTGTLASVEQLRGVRYTFIAGKGPAGEQVGVIAQELEKVYPELVRTDAVSGIKSVNYAQLTPILLEAIKELRAQVATETAHAAALEESQKTTTASIEELREQIKQLSGAARPSVVVNR